MYCGILSCRSSSPAIGLPKFAAMAEESPEVAMDTRSDEANDTEIDIDDDISVGSASPPPAPRTDTDDSMAMTEEVEIEEEATEIHKQNDKEGTQEKRTISPPEKDVSENSQNKEESEASLSPSAPRTPPIAHQANNGALQRALKFSIDNILKPDFGRRNSDPASPVSDQPVDLSRVQNLSPKSSLTVGVSQDSQPQPIQDKDKGAAPNNTLWPAWVYCTRYSDRPSAG